MLYYSKALAMKIKTLGVDHPDTAATYCGLAQALEADWPYFAWEA